jgi:hypothetical protein
LEIFAKPELSEEEKERVMEEVKKLKDDLQNLYR